MLHGFSKLSDPKGKIAKQAHELANSVHVFISSLVCQFWITLAVSQSPTKSDLGEGAAKLRNCVLNPHKSTA